MKFALGLLLGIAIGVGGTLLVVRRGSEAKVAGGEVKPDAAPVAKKGKKRRVKKRVAKVTGKTSGGVAASGGQQKIEFVEEEVEEEIPELGASDLAQGSEGDSLKPRARNVNMASGDDVRDLSQGEIDGAIRARADGITRCIVEARGAAEVKGRVVVGVVVGPEGTPVAARIEAPRWLLEHGLYRCARPVMLSMRFPAAGKDTVVTVPFDVD